jgi:thymidylate kinase
MMEVDLKLDGLKEYLSQLPDYVVLRNQEIWGHIRAGGDIDLLAQDIKFAEQTLIKRLGIPLWASRRSYVTTYFYDWGHIDLFPRIDWRGAEYVSKKSILDERQFSAEGFPRPRPAHEALVSWFSSLLWGGFFKSRYQAIIVNAAQSDAIAFKDALIHAAGKKWGQMLFDAATCGQPEKSIAWTRSIRRAVWLKSFRRRPIATGFRWSSFWIAEIRLRLLPPVPWVAILGPDGSGKSSVIAELGNAVKPIFRGVSRYHWRPRIVRKGGKDTVTVTDPHAKPPRGSIISVIKLLFLMLDWILGYWCRIVHERARERLVVFDRTFIDLLVDPRRYRYGAPRWLAQLLSHLIPQPTITIVLDAPTEVFQDRKKEVTPHETDRQRRAYIDAIRNRAGSYVIDASQPVPLVAQGVMAAVLKELRNGSHFN